MHTDIIDVKAMEVLDSRGNPTVEVDVLLEDGNTGMAMVPSGASTGKHEALELRDGGKRYDGKGVEKAVENVNEKIAPRVVGLNVFDQTYVDKIMIDLDGTPNKSALGANAILGVSMAVARAAANALYMDLYEYLGGPNAKTMPVPMMNVVNGGKHADSGLDIQEFLIVPAGAPNFKEALRYGAETFQALKSILKSMKMVTSVGDEGGFAPQLGSNEEAIEVIVEAIKKAGYTPGKDIYVAIDAAPDSFWDDTKKKYHFGGKYITTDELLDFYKKIVDKYPMISIEDPFYEEDWDGFVKITKDLGHKIQIIGDDIYVTNINRLKTGIEKKASNSILIKLNQIGTVTETLDTIEYAKTHGFTCVVSHRSGETEDTFIADLAVAANTGFLKTGSLSRSERIAKYNRLLKIESKLGSVAVYRGLDAFYSIKR